MTTSYKPVLLHAMLSLANERGWIRVAELVRRFGQFYLDRLSQGLPVEKLGSRIGAVAQMNDSEIERLIFAMPFEKFERRSFFIRPKEIEYVAFSPDIWRRLSDEEKKKAPGAGRASNYDILRTVEADAFHLNIQRWQILHPMSSSSASNAAACNAISGRSGRRLRSSSRRMRCSRLISATRSGFSSSARRSRCRQ